MDPTFFVRASTSDGLCKNMSIEEAPAFGGKWLTHLSLPSIHCAIVIEKGIDPTQVGADGLGPVPRQTGSRECD
jgi:hypothetical protein